MRHPFSLQHILTGLFLLGTIISYAAAGPHVIEQVNGMKILCEDGSSLTVSKTAKIRRDGYEFTIDDLRPGWVIEFDEDGGNRLVRKIDVVGIPVVRNYPRYDGIRETVAVSRVELGMMPAAEALQGVDIQQAIETITRSALEATGRFHLVDLASRTEVLNEHDFAQSGYADQESAPAAGRMLTAKYLAKISILDFDNRSRSGRGFRAAGAHFNSATTKARLTLELRLTEIETGRLVETVHTTRSYRQQSKRVSVNLSETAAALASNASGKDLKRLERLAAAGIAISGSGFTTCPIGELLSLTIDDLVSKMIAQTRDIPWRSVVIKVADNNMVVIRGGEDVGLKAGDRFSVTRESEAMYDPETGANLGGLKLPVGNIEVLQVQEKVSIASTSGGLALNRGDICVLERGDS